MDTYNNVDNNVDNVAQLVREQEHNYISGTPTKISKYVDFDMHDNIEKIQAYLNSKHTSGPTDALGRDKPFFNIVTAAVNIWYRATDIDRKNIRVKATRQKDIFAAFVATQKLQEWMRKTAFGVFLNKWGRILAQYGSAVVKFVEKDGQLYSIVVDWNKLIIDQVSMDKAPIIEKLELTPAELRKNKSYDQEMVEKLITAHQTRENLDGEKIDNKNDYIILYEVHGELPMSYLKAEGDPNKFVQQMHVISYIESKEQGEYDDYCLYSGREEKNPYMITHLIEEEGRTLAIGAVEHLFEAQWMQNHTAKSIKDQLDLSSKLIFQTADGNYVGQNALYAIENGDILIHKENMPLTQIQNNSHDISALQSFGQQWSNLGKEITSTPDSISGNTMPSGTAYRQVAILNQESHSLFEIMTENKGLAVEEMLRRFVIPHLKKQLNTTDEIVSVLESHDITKVDGRFVKFKGLKQLKSKIKEFVLKGEAPLGLNLQDEMTNVQEMLADLGNQRFFVPSEQPDKTWKEVFLTIEWDLEVEITPENTDKEVVLTTLSTVFQTIGGNPAFLQNPDARMLFNKILEETGRVSPIELAQSQVAQPPAAAPATAPTQPAPQFST